MYRGNMYEFIENLAEYILQEYKIIVSLDKSLYDGRTPAITLQTRPHGNSWVFYKVADSENFEEQVYEIVRNHLKAYKLVKE